MLPSTLPLVEARSFARFMLQSLPMRDVEIVTEWRSTVSKVMQLFRGGRILRAGLGFVLALNACSLLAQETTSQTSDSAQQARDEQIQNLQRKLDEIQQQIIQLKQANATSTPQPGSASTSTASATAASNAAGTSTSMPVPKVEASEKT